MATKKPCPGCGEVVPSRRANQVCGSCSLAISDYRRLKEIVKRNEEKAGQTLAKEIILPSLPEEVKDVMRALPTDSQGKALATKEFWAAWWKLMNYIRSEKERKYKEGVKRGTSLLQRLNDGSITMEDFEFRRKYPGQ